ncbi:serine hydrolase [Nocardiopsis alba]|uniref:Serine hydrolase n=1 Tax=Nocardiopsis alba TaxID=53437 RepID=A0A7K2IPG2_9ACTN|nr:serine hydrolase domain-containing protein [Nocardiopsis alba]MYR31861.1 serine hydrolase [Nocardiopsis alba]
MSFPASPPVPADTPPTSAPRRRPRAPAAPRRVLLIALAAGVAVALLTLLLLPLLPHRSATGASVEGDPGLAADVEAALDPAQVQGLAVARFDNDDPDAAEWVFAGTADGSTPVGPDTPFETASVVKVLTGMLLADMIERGETSPDRTLAEVFPDMDFADPEVASITLEELATHHAGLVTETETGAGSLLAVVQADMYRWARDPLEFVAGTASFGRGSYQYSNAGYAVLGEALAAEAGIDRADLLRERILEPLGMDSTVALADGVPEGGAGPHGEAGARIQDWRNTDYAAAGIAVWSTPEDLTRLMAAVAREEAPGLASLDPVRERVDSALPGAAPEGLGMGLGWHLLEVPDVGEVAWHSGGTLGSRSMIATDGERSVVIMANSFGVEAPALGFALLGEDPEPVPSVRTAPVQLVLTVSLSLLAPTLLFALALRRRTLITQRPLDRMRIVSLGLGSLAWLLYILRNGAWSAVPPAVWAAGVALAVAGLALGVWQWRRVPVEAGRFRWLHVTVFVFSTLFSLTLAGLSGWSLLTTW